MAEDYTSGLNILLGNKASNQVQPGSPEQDLQNLYEQGMETGPTGFDQLINSSTINPVENQALDRYAAGQAAGQMAADEYGKLDELRYGQAPQQQIIDPAEMVSSAGQRAQRALKAGWGDLVAGTGDTIDFVTAAVMPGEGDLTTTLGSYLKKVGTEYQKENALILSEDLQDITWQDMFDGEFWSSKVSRLVPYALSFMIPYAGGSMAATRMLGRFGPKVLKSANKSGKFGRAGKGVGLKDVKKGKPGSGVLGYLAVDLGKKGVQPTQLLRNVTGYIGGGTAANLAEGAYLSGEAYNEMVNEVDENGNPLFTPQEAAHHAAGVMVDNAAWIGVDALQYGILFGGMGRGVMGRVLRNPVQKTPFAQNMKGLTGMFMRRVAPNLPAAAAYASIEGVTEGFQEAFQEWAKYAEIQEAKGLDWESWTTWLKEAPFGEDRPELRDIFWSSVGLGVAMGGARGYYDSAAERTRALHKQADAYNNTISLLKDGEKLSAQEYTVVFRQAVANMIAANVWNYSGDGSVAMSIVDNMVKDGKMTEEAAAEYKQAIEQSEKNYEKHSVNTGLTEAGAEQAFYNETVLSILAKQKESQTEAYNAYVKKQKEVLKGQDKKLNQILEQAEAEHLGVLESIAIQEAEITKRIQDIYTRKLDTAPIAKSTGARDKRFKEAGLSKEEFEAFTQEGEKQKTEKEKAEAKEKPTITEQVKGVGAKAFETVKDIGGKAVEGVKGLFGKAKEKADSKEVKDAIEKIKAYDTKGAAAKITSRAKDKLIDAVKAGKIAAKKALEIVGTGIGKVINDKDVASALRKAAKEKDSTEAETKTSKEDVKKKDQPTVVPKNEKYRKTEESLKQKGKLNLDLSSISKVKGSKEKPASPFSYIIKTTTDKTIKFFAKRNVDIRSYTKTVSDVVLRLVEPVAGKADVVEVNGKLYFQYKKGAPLYESKIEVVVDGKVIGEVEQATDEFFKEQEVSQTTEKKKPTKKAKKKDQRKIDQLIGAVKQAKEKIKSYLSKTQKEIPNYKATGVEAHPLYRYGSGVGEAQMVRNIVEKKFPGARGFVAFNKLIDDYGQEASSLAIGSTILINEDSVFQSDIIHEAGHIYYTLMGDTPLMKKINKLLPKSEIYQRTKQDYPELILMKFEGLNMTLGLIYREIFKNTDKKYDSFTDIRDIVKNIAEAEKAQDSARVNDLFQSLRTQIKINGGKDVAAKQQTHLLEETFARTLEAYSYGTVDAVIKGTAAQKQLEKDLIQFYKEVKNLATEEEARKLLDSAVDNIADLDLEAAIKTILLNFDSADRTVPFVLNSAYGAINKANKKILSKTASYSSVSSYIAEFMDRNLSSEEITERVVQAIADDSGMKRSNKIIKDIEPYVYSVIIQRKDKNNLAQADKILDAKLSQMGLTGKHKEGDNVDVISEDYKREEEKLRVLPTTTTNFIKKIVEYYNRDKDEKSMIDSKKILSAIMSLAKDTKNNPYDFVIQIRESKNPDMQAMVLTMDEIYSQVEGIENPKRYTNAKLVELKGPIEGINIEVLAHNVLSIGDNGQRAWYRNLSTSMTIEKKVIDSIVKGLFNNVEKEKRIAEIYNRHLINNEYDAGVAAEKILTELFNVENGEFINKELLLNNQITFRGKKQFIQNILFDYKLQRSYVVDGKTKYRRKPIYKLTNENLFTVFSSKENKFTHNSNGFKPEGIFRGSQIEIKDIVTQALVMSRAENYITMVDNVEQDGVSVLNKDNGLWSRTKNVFDIANSGITFGKKDLINPEHNIFVAIAQLQGKEEGRNNLNPFNITLHNGMKRYFVQNAYGLKNKEGLARKANDLNPNELTVGDFFMFLSRYNQGKENNQKTIYYDQPIAVFSDKSRRYYIESIIAHDAKSRKALLSRVEKNPAYKSNGKRGTYKNGDLVFPFTIENNNIVGKDMNKLVNEWYDYIQKNKELFKNNKDLNKILNKGKLSRKVLEAFLISSAANKFMAQQLFVHDHRQSKNEIDYIKRAAGAIAGHTVLDRNTSVEFFVTNDYYVAKDDYVAEDGKRVFTEEEAKDRFGENWENEVAVENDAMGYVLPEQAELITAKYGDAQKVGNVFKFVYHYTELEGPLKDRTTYMKFAVHTLTPEMEASSLYLKNLGDALRARTFEVEAMSKNKGNLVIGASQSAAKLYAGEQRYIHDIASTDNIGDMMEKQDEIYTDETGYKGLSGEGFGIQLELDKQTDERFFPSQLFYNLLTNITTENKKQVARMLELRKLVMETNNKNRNGSIIGVSENKDVLVERENFKSSVTADIYDVLIESSYDNLHPMFPYLNAVHNAVATGRITHKGTKMYIKGSIGYQSSSIGMDLKSYQKGLYKGEPLKSSIDVSLAKNEDIVVSEAIVPGYLYDQGVRIGDLFIGTRVPAHGKVSSSVFIVKDFHKQIKGTPTSNITIPAWVSKYWGADLDGDSIHMNFRYTQEEVKKDSWKGQSNEFFDLYVDLVSQENRQREITADIDFQDVSKQAIENVEKVFGKIKKDKPSQLTPMGDAQMFEDNVPAKKLVGIIAALMRTFNLFSNSQDRLPVSISIKNDKGTVERDRFFDDAELENKVGNWYGVAQLLNISLDNAKFQYASKLGMNFESIFSFVTLRRLGYSLEDIALMFNSPLVKQYLEYKRGRSQNYISKDSDIMQMFDDKNDQFENQFLTFIKDEKLGIDLSSTIKNKKIKIDLTNIKSKEQQKKILELIYILDSYNKNIVKPFSKAFTVHQTIEKNPLELSKINNKIKEIVKGPLNLITKWGKQSLTYELQQETKSNFILDHATTLFDAVLDRANIADIRYSNYIKDILENPMAQKSLQKLGESKSEVINQVIANNIKNQIGLIKDNRGKDVLIKEFEAIKKLEKNKDNMLLKNVLQVSENKKNIVINRQAITEFTSYKSISEIKNEFSKLNSTEKDLLFEIEYMFNLFGYTGGAGKATSFVPFFDNEYVQKINDGMLKVIKHNEKDYKIDLDRSPVPGELLDAIKDVEDRKAGKDKFTASQRRDKASKDNNNIIIGDIKKPKKVITPDTSFNGDYLAGGVETLSFRNWAADKGIDIDKIEKKSNTFKILTENYSKYKNHLKLAKEFESSLAKKPLSKYTMEGLYTEARRFRKMDNSATKGVAHMLEKEIGQRAFRKQSQFLKEAGKDQGYNYKIPGVDGVAQDDLTNFQAWLGSNNMTSKRPEIQYLINEAQKDYRKYIKSFKEHKNLIEEKNRALVRSKMKDLSVLERIRKEFDTNARYQYIYGNLATVENGNVRLYTPEEIVANGVELTKEEKEYYIRYKAVAEILLGSEEGKTVIPGLQMGTIENMARSGLFGLYNAAIDSNDYYKVRVRGTDLDGNKVIKTYYEWKYDVYKGRTGKLRLKSGKEIYELDKLRRKAKSFKQQGMHEDKTPILLSDTEYDALVNNGSLLKRMVGYDKTSNIDAELIKEYERRKGVKAQNISYDINTTLLEFTRGHIFRHGEGRYQMKDGKISERDDRFTGMDKVAILTDSIIGFNKDLDNKNAVKYLTEWWKEGFLEKKQQTSALGKTGDKVIDSFVRLTSLRLLGFNMSVGLGNILAGKYQELRKRGGKQFIKGEARYWKDMLRSRDILKKHRIVEYSFDEFIHLSEKSGPLGRLERFSYLFMDKSEAYIQGASFLGMLTDKEYNTGVISEDRVMYINNKITTLHGEGYTALDASLLSMYSYGRALLQFKKWFITLINDRFKAEDIDRFGEVNIGSYRASSEFVTDLFRKYFAGELTKDKIKEIYNNSSEKRKQEMRNHVSGIGIGVTLLSLIAMMEDDDEPDTFAIRRLKKLSHDVFITTDIRRFVNYTAVPSSYGTMKNAAKAIQESVSEDRVKRTGPYAKRGESQAGKTFKYEISPFAEARKDLMNILGDDNSNKKETSSLIR